MHGKDSSASPSGCLAWRFAVTVRQTPQNWHGQSMLCLCQRHATHGTRPQCFEVRSGITLEYWHMTAGGQTNRNVRG